MQGHIMFGRAGLEQQWVPSHRWNIYIHEVQGEIAGEGGEEILYCAGEGDQEISKNTKEY